MEMFYNLVQKTYKDEINHTHTQVSAPNSTLGKPTVMVSFPNKGQTTCALGSPLNFSVHESMCFEREIRTQKKSLGWVTGTSTKCVWGWRRKWHFFFLFFFFP